MTSVLGAECDKIRLDYEAETELRLGLPGANGNEVESTNNKNNGKRVFSQTVDLKLNLSSKDSTIDINQVVDNMKEKKNNNTNNIVVPTPNDPAKPPAK